MPQYVIEREVPDAGQMTDDQLAAVSKKSLESLGQLRSNGCIATSRDEPDMAACQQLAQLRHFTVPPHQRRRVGVNGQFECDRSLRLRF